MTLGRFVLCISVYFGSLLAISSAAIPCDDGQDFVQECLKPLAGYEYEMDNAIVPTMDPNALKEHCKRYDQFEECMQPIKDECHDIDKLHYEGIEAYYQFLCYDGHDDYIVHRECFMNHYLYREGDRCNHTFVNSQLELISDRPIPVQYARDRICQYTNQYLDCVENVVESFCKTKAAKWQRKLDTYYYNPTLTAIGCPLDTGSSVANWIAITVGVLIPISLVIVIVSVVILVVHQRKKRRPAAAGPSGPSVEAPPSYSGPYVMYNPSAQAVSQQAGPIPDKANLPPEPPAYQPSPDPAYLPGSGAHYQTPELVSGSGAQYETLEPVAGSRTTNTTSEAVAESADIGVSNGYFGVGSDLGDGSNSTRIGRDNLPAYQPLP